MTEYRAVVIWLRSVAALRRWSKSKAAVAHQFGLVAEGLAWIGGDVAEAAAVVVTKKKAFFCAPGPATWEALCMAFAVLAEVHSADMARRGIKPMTIERIERREWT